MDVFTALSHPTRRRIVELLAERERTVMEIAAEFELSAPAITQHLNILRQAGLVRGWVDQQRRIQALSPEGFNQFVEWVAKTRQSWQQRLKILEEELKRSSK
ncbi:MAG: metalloregulator ArsR/SmtB family transcription factor [Verrucomicrobiota bacterium]|nr:metalloregulator ArsR/SmtB family transcription factor [Verrucomicrobiota bacterium]